MNLSKGTHSAYAEFSPIASAKNLSARLTAHRHPVLGKMTSRLPRIELGLALLESLRTLSHKRVCGMKLMH